MFPYVLNLFMNYVELANAIKVQSPAVATQHPRWSLFSVSISVVGSRQTTK